MEELRALLLSDSLTTTVSKLLSQRTVVNSTEDLSRLKKLPPKNKDLKVTNHLEKKMIALPASLLVTSAIPQLKPNSDNYSNHVVLLRRSESLLIMKEEQEALLILTLKAMMLLEKPSKSLELKLMAEPSELTTQVARLEEVKEEAEEATVVVVEALAEAVVVAVEALAVAVVVAVEALAVAAEATVVAVEAMAVAVEAMAAAVVDLVIKKTPCKTFLDNLSINRRFTIRTQI